MKQIRTRKTRFSQLASVLVACFMLLAFAAAPAFAHHKDGHEGQASAQSSDSSSSTSSKGKPSKGDKDGDADSDPNTTYTEDNDTNDNNTPNNQADEGDNAHPSGKDRSVEHGKSTKNPNQGKAESDPDDDGRGPDRTNGGPDKPNGSGGVDKADQDGNNGCGNDDDFEDDNEGWCGKGKTKPDTTKPNNPTCPSGTEMHGKTCKPVTTKPNTDKPCDADASMPGTQPCKTKTNKPCDANPAMPGTQPCEKDKAGKITICHATGSMTNPYVIITISENGLNGHADHEGDIIPLPANGLCPAVGGTDTVNPGTDTPDIDTDNSRPDVVLGDDISRDRTPDVAADSVSPAQRAAKVLGAVLPFTGASLVAFLVAAFGLIAAGFAALRARKS